MLLSTQKPELRNSRRRLRHRRLSVSYVKKSGTARSLKYVVTRSKKMVIQSPFSLFLYQVTIKAAAVTLAASVAYHTMIVLFGAPISRWVSPRGQRVVKI